MKLTVLGSGTCVPSLKRGGPGILLNIGAKNLLIDCGMGSLHKLLSLGITYQDIDYLLFTHIHPDHIAELVSFLFTCNYGQKVRTRPLTILGSRDFHQFLEKLYSVYGHWIEAQHYQLESIQLTDGQRWNGEGFILKAGMVQHTESSLAYRVEADNRRTDIPHVCPGSIVISGDTDYCAQIIDIARGCDLLVLECSLPDKAQGHLTPDLAGQIASQSACRRLLLTHFYPPCDSFPVLEQCRKNFDGEVILAQDLLEILF